MTQFGIATCCVVFTIILQLTSAQLPPRPLNIAGAIPSPPQKAAIRQRLQQLDAPIPRRRHPQNAIPITPIREVRPVVEEIEEEEPRQNTFDEEVAKFGLSSLQNIQQQQQQVEEDRPIPFRPERPVPVLRTDIREQKQLPVLRQEVARPVIRQELKQEQAFAPRPAPQRQEYREEAPIPVRRPAPQPQIVRQAPQPARHVPARIAPRPQYADQEEHSNRVRKPPVQILRKYRTDNADGSITWGYENEDGTFKEENIGIDCITRGKYGYVDPDGVRREYSYETGGRCEDPEELAELPPQQPAKGGKKPYRPQPQYLN